MSELLSILGDSITMTAVTKEDVARLHAYLIVPIAVNEALNMGTPLDPETQYGLHVSLSEIEPDSAMLAIALSAQRIASDFINDIPVATALKMEADKIVSEYGPEWLANFHNHPVQGEDLFNLLCNVPEDLESLADLLGSVQSSMLDDTHPAFTLCSVLSIQARAHMEIADYVLTELENEALELEQDFDGVCNVASVNLMSSHEDNIILFPIHRCR